MVSGDEVSIQVGQPCQGIERGVEVIEGNW